MFGGLVENWSGILAAIYCALIVLASLAGGSLPLWVKLTHRRMQIAVSFVGGLMLGVAVFHLWPHALAEVGSSDRVAMWLMIGLLTMFFLIRALHFHQHHSAEVGSESAPGLNIIEHDHRHDHDRGECQEHHLLASHVEHPVHNLSWFGVAFGLALHTLIDGIALAASVQSEAAAGSGVRLLGLGTFTAIALHKPLDSVSITSLMTASGYSASSRRLVNISFAMMCPAGVILFWAGVDRFGQQHAIVGSALAFSAGVFLCIALGDLLPELEFHSHDRVQLSLALLGGVALAYAIGFLEPPHAHRHVAPNGVRSVRSRHAPRDELSLKLASIGRSVHHAERDGYVTNDAPSPLAPS
ncbi:MAG: ZIP family metal transporter [Planctomycetales bacterium]|nr:ZIP family metal transporter [Planctomycetales bacterium]